MNMEELNQKIFRDMLNELKETWDFTQEELFHIKELMLYYGDCRYLDGYNDRQIDLEKSFTAYGKKEDWE